MCYNFLSILKLTYLKTAFTKNFFTCEETIYISKTTKKINKVKIKTMYYQNLFVIYQLKILIIS